MAGNPVELIGGLTSTTNVVKADIVAWAKARVPQVFADATEIRNTTLSGQLVFTLKTTGQSWFLDTADTTTADDGINCIISGDGKRFKPLSYLPLPTIASVGGVFASAAVTNQFLTGVGTDGNVTRAQPSAANLSNGTTGSGAVVLASGATLTTPNIGAATATSVNKVTITGPATSATLTIADGKTFTASNTLTFTGTDGNSFAFPSGSDTVVVLAANQTLTNKSINASNNTISNLTTSMFAANVVDTDATLAANSSTRLPAQSAVKSYIDNLLTGLSWKGAVAAATTSNITLSGTQTIDGVAVVAGNRVLVKNQSTGSQNGIYVVAAGTWSRASDMDTAAEFPGAAVFVQGGTVNADTQWTCSNDSVTVGTTAVTFAQVSGAGTYSAGTGLTLSGNQFAIDSTVVTMTGAQTLANKTLTAPNLGTPTAITLTNGTGLPISTGVSGLATGIAAFLATPSSANLRAALTDESGTGVAYFQGGDLGTPSAGVLTNATGLPTAGLVDNAVTFAKMQTIATASFLGRTTASTGNVENLTATQATAILNAMVGDSGSGGTKGLVPAPGSGDASAGKYLKADGTWAVPAGGGGGGGGMTDTERQNFLLSTVYQSKVFGGYRRLVNLFADGFKASDGINAGSSSNYSLDTTNGRVSPTQTGGESVISGALGTAGGDYSTRTSAIRDGTTSQASSAAGQSGNVGLGPARFYVDYGSGNTHVFSGFEIWSASDVDFSNGNGGTTTIVMKASNTDPTTTSWTGTTIATISAFTNAAAQYKSSLGNANATAYRYVWLELTFSASAASRHIAEVKFYETATPTTNNMTAVTTAQTADASRSNGRVLIEYNPVDAVTLNTDLTVEVTCNGGTNWASATLSSVGAGQGGRVVAETADTACTSGTSFAARIKTLNNKNVQIYGATLTVH